MKYEFIKIWKYRENSCFYKVKRVPYKNSRNFQNTREEGEPMKQTIKRLLLYLSVILLFYPIKAYGAAGVDFYDRLTPEEKQYIEDTATIPVAVSPNKGPIQYMDANGEQKGISLDVMKQLSALTGLKFEFQSISGAETMKEAVDQRQVMILSGIPVEKEVKELYQVTFSDYYLKCAYGIVVNRNDSLDHQEDMVLALTKGLDAPKELGRVKEIKRYDTIQECIEAVRNKEADVTYGNSYVLEFYAQGYQYQNLCIIPVTDHVQQLCFGVSAYADERLISILNKSIDYIGSDGILQITVKNVAASIQPITLASVISLNPQSAILITLGTIALISLAACSLLINYSHKNKMLRLEHQKHLLLSEIANEYFYEYSYKTDTLYLSEEMAKLFGCKCVYHKWREHSADTMKLLSQGIDESFDKNQILVPESVEGRHTLELLLNLKNGTKRWFCLTRTDIYENKRRYTVGMLRDIQREKEEREALMQKSLCDSLTGIYNAAATKEFINSALKKRKGGILFILDLDYFKQVNDQFGHQTGDKVIKETAAILKSTFRDSDVIGRIGGDEFIIFAAETSSDEFIEMKCGQLQAKVNQIHIAENYVQTISIGVVKAGDAAAYEQLYRQADMALYTAKENGRAGYHIAE